MYHLALLSINYISRYYFKNSKTSRDIEQWKNLYDGSTERCIVSMSSLEGFRFKYRRKGEMFLVRLVSLVILEVFKDDVYLSEVPEPPAVVLLNPWHW